MTIIEFLKQEDEATILNLRKHERWMFFWKGSWVVKQGEGGDIENIRTLIQTKDEEEAVAVLMKGIKSD